MLIVPTFWGAPRGLWFAVVLPWVLGGGILGESSGARAAAALCTDVLDSTSTRSALVVLAGVLYLVGWAFSPAAALFVLLSGAATSLLLAASVSRRTVRHLLLGSTASAVALAVALAGTEFVLRAPWIEKRLGLPQELAAWPARYDRLWERNIFHFRSPYETIARKPGVCRVLAIGDSFTWGDKIPSSDSTWPADLERDLRAERPARDVEVINAAENGWTTANEVELLRRLGWQFNPDLVVIEFFRNDALESGPYFAHQHEGDLQPEKRLVPLLFRTGTVRSSALLAFIESRFNSLLLDPDDPRPWLGLYRDGERGWLQAQQALRDAADSASRRHVPVVLMLFPTFFDGSWTPATYPLQPISERVGRFASGLGIHVLDLAPVFAAEGLPWERWRALPYDGHPSAAAYRLAARALDEYIDRQGLLAQPPGPESHHGDDAAPVVPIPHLLKHQAR